MNKVHSYNRFREILRERHEPSAMRILCTVYWRTLLLLACAAFVSMLGFGLFELRVALATLDKRNEPLPNQAPVITRKNVDEAVDAFSKRHDQYEQLKLAPLSIVDPSSQ